jgi:hypothetical protein
MSSKKCKQYKDLVVAPNSDMFKAMEEGDTDKVAKMYKDGMAEFYEANPNWKPFRIGDELNNGAAAK